MPRTDLYGILGVPRSATPEEIKRAFRQRAREFHPDVNQDPRADERFKEINEAYQVLSDPERRALYDRTGRIGSGAPAPRGFNPCRGSPLEDIFDAFFGRARP